MSARQGPALLRMAVVGATGAVGGEVLGLLESRRFPLQELVPVATERSLGDTVELLGHDVPVETELASLAGLDLVVVCTPPADGLEWVRRALRERVACIDLSGAVAGAPEVPLLAADEEPDAEALRQPVIAGASGTALAWRRVLAPLAGRAGLRRVVATALEPVSGAGRAGVEALEVETRALFNQQEPPEPCVFDHGIAFDCLPAAGAPDDAGRTPFEQALARDLGRLLGAPLALAVTSLRLPIFAGAGAVLALETEEALDASACADLLAKTPGVALCAPGAAGPSTRDSVGRDEVLVGRVRPDPTRPHGLLLWVAADPIRLAAVNALRLAEARFRSA